MTCHLIKRDFLDCYRKATAPPISQKRENQNQSLFSYICNETQLSSSDIRHGPPQIERALLPHILSVNPQHLPLPPMFSNSFVSSLSFHFTFFFFFQSFIVLKKTFHAYDVSVSKAIWLVDYG